MSSGDSSSNSDKSYSFDESGVAFSFFLVVLTALYVLPRTYFLLFGRRRHNGPSFISKYSYREDSKTEKGKKEQVECWCDACREHQTLSGEIQSRKRTKFTVIADYALLALGWLIMAAALTVAMRAKSDAVQYDPFVVLGVPNSANDATIRKAYKKLSLKFHPDKVKRTEDKALAEKKFVEISKAYRALTDPDTKRNWLEYGNPDGVRTFKLGIALPLWMVSGKSSVLVLLIYVILCGLGVPLLVSKLWNRSKTYTRDRILHDTMKYFYGELKEGMTVKKLLEILSGAHEFRKLPPIPNEQALLTQLQEHLTSYCQENSIEQLEIPKKVSHPQQSKAYILLFAHTHRIPFPSSLTLLKQQQAIVVDKSIRLAQGILQICLARKWVTLSLNCMHLTQCLVSAVPSEAANPLLMLPFIDHNIIRHCKTNKRHIASIKDLLLLDTEGQRSLLRSLSDSQFDLVFKVAYQIPILQVDSISFAIVGQQAITPDGIVTVKVKLSMTNHYLKYVLKEEPAKEEAENPDKDVRNDSESKTKDEGEDEDDSLLDEDDEGGSGKARRKILLGTGQENRADPIHAPYCPSTKSPGWWLVLTNRAGTSLIATPVKVMDVNLRKGATKSLQFEAPNRPGTVPMRLQVISDCLLGADLDVECSLTVVPETNKKLEMPEWDISGDEESNQKTIGTSHVNNDEDGDDDKEN